MIYIAHILCSIKVKTTCIYHTRYSIYHKQQKLSGRKVLQIFDESQKFSLLIDRHHTVDTIMEAKSQRFSQHFHKSYQITKLFSHLTFVAYSMPIFDISIEFKLCRYCITGLMYHDMIYCCISINYICDLILENRPSCHK